MTARPFDRFDGVLFFPVTSFDERDRVGVAVLEEHVADRVALGAGGVFAAGGTGEYHALGLDEIRAVYSSSRRSPPERVCSAPGWRTSTRLGSAGRARFVDKYLAA